MNASLMMNSKPTSIYTGNLISGQWSNYYFDPSTERGFSTIGGSLNNTSVLGVGILALIYALIQDPPFHRCFLFFNSTKPNLSKISINGIGYDLISQNSNVYRFADTIPNVFENSQSYNIELS
jgi:hypothetical protein